MYFFCLVNVINYLLLYLDNVINKFMVLFSKCFGVVSVMIKDAGIV